MEMMALDELVMAFKMVIHNHLRGLELELELTFGTFGIRLRASKLALFADIVKINRGSVCCMGC